MFSKGPARLLPVWVAAFLLIPSFLRADSDVKVWQEQITIPTYLPGMPELNPMFFFGRESQGAQGPVYPYPMYDSLTGKKLDKSYTAVYLENEYIRIGILPEVGGRIFEGVDKTDHYNFIYRQHVIKPALIGLIGAWISGGVEWNIPHHHRATTILPVQYKVEENADGSKTVWVGELEIRQRMRWAVGYTLRPGKAYLKASVRIVNRTPTVNTMLCFANLAVHASQDYQVIFPPGTQLGVFHGKREFTAWPISHSTYNGADFTKGVDISWYKNHIQANSVFAWNYEDDFFAGYDHGKQAGTISVADHNVVPGKKFWTWGNGPSGKAWDKILTDEDGPYIELMTGAYSDNQPDYSWLQPYETRSFSLNWYPFRDIGGVKKANLQAAVNLDVANGNASIGFCTTSAHRAAEVMLKAGRQILLRETIAIDPGKPYRKQIALPTGVDEHDLVASISDAGKELISYQPIRQITQPMPKAVGSPAAPRDLKTNEELYLTGLRAQQFHDPNLDPMPYWEEALRRDPGDARVNTVMGITFFTRARYEEAEKYLRTALNRLTDRYTAPKDAEAVYYLGATLKAEEKTDEAYTWLYKATWSQAWKAPAYYALAEIAAGRGDMTTALDLVSRSIDSNALNIRAQNLKAAVLRHLDRSSEALEVLASASHRADPLDVRSMAETWLASRSAAATKTLASTMYQHPSTAQETAAEYLDAGLWQDGTDVLLQMAEAAPDRSKVHPMVYYYLGYFAGKSGQPERALEFYKLAKAVPADYVFPFQNEEIPVLRQAIRSDPQDPRASYYLGNLLYDWQPDEAVRMWKASESIDPSFAIVHRNLATAYMHQKSGADREKAVAELETAVSLDRKYPLHFTELDELYEQVGAPLEKRLSLFEKNAAVVGQRDDSENRLIALKVALGSYDEAIRIMSSRPFAVAEGANLNVSEHWTDAHVLRSQQSIGAGRYQQSLADLRAAVAIPPNLPIGLGDRVSVRNAEVAYWTGVAYEGMGDHEKAVENWNRAAAQREGDNRRAYPISEETQPYYRALALKKLGRSDSARAVLQKLMETAKRSLHQPLSTGEPAHETAQQSAPRVQSADAHYLMGLAYLGLDERPQAKEELNQAVEMSPDLVGARAALASLQ